MTKAQFVDQQVELFITRYELMQGKAPTSEQIDCAHRDYSAEYDSSQQVTAENK